MQATGQPEEQRPTGRTYPFRRAVLRGLGIVLPPLLTVVIFLWVGSTVQVYVLRPVKDGAREALLWSLWDVREQPSSAPAADVAVFDGRTYVRLENRQYVPANVYDYVEEHVSRSPAIARVPSTPDDLFRLYVEQRFLKDYVVIPVFLCCFVLLLYLLGKFLAAGIGTFFWSLFERGILRLPLVRSVYSSVKQVTDFMFSQGQPKFIRVVAVEYPRERMWTIGLVTGAGLPDVNSAANEPMLSVMLACSPMPVTGYVVIVPARKTVSLDISVEQALQYIVSCGVVAPLAALSDKTGASHAALATDSPPNTVSATFPAGS